MVEQVTASVAVRWIGGRLMLGVDSGGRTVALSHWSDRDPPWTGCKPSDLLLIAAAACATYDVVEILTRQREPLMGLEAHCSGDQLADPPYRFTAIRIHFVVSGPVSPSKVERALELAIDKYCSVVNTLRPALPVTYDYEIAP